MVKINWPFWIELFECEKKWAKFHGAFWTLTAWKIRAIQNLKITSLLDSPNNLLTESVDNEINNKYKEVGIEIIKTQLSSLK